MDTDASKTQPREEPQTYETLHPQARVYVDRVARELYQIERDGKPAEPGPDWDKAVSEPGDGEIGGQVAAFRAKALRCVVALAEVMPQASKAA